jgi:hypothetical protein
MKLIDLPCGTIDWKRIPSSLHAGETGTGAMTIEHRDGRRYLLTAGVSWHVADDGASAHRVVSEGGATVFIVD